MLSTFILSHINSHVCSTGAVNTSIPHTGTINMTTVLNTRILLYHLYDSPTELQATELQTT
jgi:hypothetical protein